MPKPHRSTQDILRIMLGCFIIFGGAWFALYGVRAVLNFMGDALSWENAIKVGIGAALVFGILAIIIPVAEETAEDE